MSSVHPIDGTASDETSSSGGKTSIIELFKRCFICQKDIGNMIGIYIYKDMAFCSNDCRNKEMEKDTELEKPKNQLKMKRIKRSRKNSTPMRAIIYFTEGSSSSDQSQSMK